MKVKEAKEEKEAKEGKEEGAGGRGLNLDRFARRSPSRRRGGFVSPASQDIGRLSLLNGFHCSLLSFYLEQRPASLAHPGFSGACRVLGRTIMQDSRIKAPLC